MTQSRLTTQFIMFISLQTTTHFRAIVSVTLSTPISKIEKFKKSFYQINPKKEFIYEFVIKFIKKVISLPYSTNQFSYFSYQLFFCKNQDYETNSY